MPRRKSSASDADEHKPKTARKQFHVGGGASKSHLHGRVPSHGKKLNQLTRLTTMTQADGKQAVDPTATDGSPRRASIQRSASQRSLSEHRHVKRNSSSSDVRKTRRPSATHQGGATRPQKPTGPPRNALGDDSQGEWQDENASAEVSAAENEQPEVRQRGNGEHSNKSSQGRSRAKPTFVIDEEERSEDDGEGETGATTVAAAPPRAEVVPANAGSPQADPNKQSLQTQAPANPRSTPSRSARQPPSRAGSGYDSTAPAILRSPSIGQPARPKLTAESARPQYVSRAPSRAGTMDDSKTTPSQSLPSQSQPLTSRFLDSPRKAPLRRESGQVPATDEQDQPAPAQLVTRIETGATAGIFYQSPHASATNLGGGSSRTQQKLMLQRASSIYDLDAMAELSDETSKANLQSKLRREVERIGREYRNVCRYRNPMRESTTRLYRRGMLDLAPMSTGSRGGTPSSSLRRTMTQTALGPPTPDPHGSSRQAGPRSSQSYGELARGSMRRSQTASVGGAGAVEPSMNAAALDLVLRNLWESEPRKQGESTG